MENFWEKLPRPFVCLAPMEAVTDTVFRRVVVRAAANYLDKSGIEHADQLGVKQNPFVMFTEFTCGDGLFGGSNFEIEQIRNQLKHVLAMGSDGDWNGEAGLTEGCQKLDCWHGEKEEISSYKIPLGEGFEKVSERLWYTREEKPLVAQIWGSQPEYYYQTAKLMVKMGFDGVDINMGCPDKSVLQAGLGSALVKDKKRAAEFIQATKAGLAGRIPISVKMRIGYKEIETIPWSEFLLVQGIDALIVHGRTTKQMSKVPADWTEIAKVVELRNSMGIKTYVIGNGDVASIAESKQKAKLYGVDGVMIGRGIFGNPWLFADMSGENVKPNIEKRLQLLLWHTRLYISTWGKRKPFKVLRKFYKIYCQEFDGAKELRIKLMETNTPEEVEQIIEEFICNLHQN